MLRRAARLLPPLPRAAAASAAAPWICSAWLPARCAEASAATAAAAAAAAAARPRLWQRQRLHARCFAAAASRDDDEITDPYAVLGVPSSASAAELKKAYRREAMKWHPDRHASEPAGARAAAEAKFKRASAAYAIATDPAARSQWERSRAQDAARRRQQADWEAHQRQGQQQGRSRAGAGTQWQQRQGSGADAEWRRRQADEWRRRQQGYHDPFRMTPEQAEHFFRTVFGQSPRHMFEQMQTQMRHGPGVVSTRVFEETSRDSAGRTWVITTVEKRYANGHVQRDETRRQVGGPGYRPNQGGPRAERTASEQEQDHERARQLSEAFTAVIAAAATGVFRTAVRWFMANGVRVLLAAVRTALRIIFRR